MMAVSGAPSLPEAQLDDFYHPERFPDWPGKYRVQMQYMGFRRALLSTQRNFSRRNQRPDFEQVGRSGLPVLLIWGKEDEGVPVETSDLVRQMIPQAEYHEIEEAAHLPHYERPEVVNPILLEFLKRTTAAQSGSQ